MIPEVRGDRLHISYRIIQVLTSVFGGSDPVLLV